METRLSLFKRKSKFTKYSACWFCATRVHRADCDIVSMRRSVCCPLKPQHCRQFISLLCPQSNLRRLTRHCADSCLRTSKVDQAHSPLLTAAMAFNLERSNNLKLLQSSDSTLSRQTMRSLAEYDSEGNPELEDTSPVPPDEAPGQHRMLPDVDAIIKETRVDIKETRQKADKLFHQFAKSYVATAGELREGAIQKYRERLEGLTAEDRAKVCETLAKDEIVCSMMQFGENRYSFGGVSFRYNTQNDAAFNRLSHHAWKDCEHDYRLPPAQ